MLETEIKAPKTKNQKPKLVNFWLAELNYLKKGLSAWPLYLLLLVTLLLFSLAYQTPLDWAVKLGVTNPADRLYIQSFNQPEANSELSFRWSSADSRIRFAGVGRLPLARLDLTMQIGGRPPELGPAQVQLWHDETLIGQVEVGAGEKVYSFYYRPERFDSRQLNGDLIFALRVPNAFNDKQHNLPLGVVVSEVHLVGGSENNRLVIPALSYLAILLTGLIVFYLALIRSGWGTGWAALWSSGLACGIAWALATARLHLTPALEPLFLLLLLSYPLLVLGLRVTGLWLRQNFTIEAARWLGLIFVTAFVVKAAGMSHPAFNPVDHWFRVHQILRFWQNPAEFWAQYYNVSAGASVTGAESGSAVLGQWGVNFSLPYSPLFYIFAAPFALIWPTHDPNLLAAVNNLVTWLEASQIFLLYIIARRAYSGAWASRAGIIAAALFGFYPLSFLLFSDGGYNSIFAHWLTLLFVTLLVSSIPLTAKWSRWRWAGLILTLTAALLAHTSTLLLTGLLVLILTGLWFSQRDCRWLARRLALVGVAALSLALLLYYGYYGLEFITQSLPTLISKLGSTGNLGQNNKLLGTNLLSGFWPQLWEHFRLFPFLLTLVALFLLTPRKIQSQEDSGQWSVVGGQQEKLSIVASPPVGVNPQSSIVNRQSKAVWLVWLAWLTVFLLMALLDLRVNLLQKHMLFAAPLLCLGTGFALSLLWEIVLERTKKLNSKRQVELALAGIIGLLVAFMVWQGLILWYGRIYYYLLPPGSG